MLLFQVFLVFHMPLFQLGDVLSLSSQLIFKLETFVRKLHRSVFLRIPEGIQLLNLPLDHLVHLLLLQLIVLQVSLGFL